MNLAVINTSDTRYHYAIGAIVELSLQFVHYALGK